MASNSITIADEDGDYEDWIEIYYNGQEPLSLDGYGLSDDDNQPFRWVFPDTTVQPGEFILVWASNKNRAVSGGELHTNFAISASGEEVVLTRPDGIRLDELQPTEIPTDISIGRKPDGSGSWLFFREPTPGMSNDTEGYSEQLDPPVFSHAAGFYTEEFELNISHPDPDVTFYYTLDGSEPTENSNRFENSILITDRSFEPNNFSNIPTNNITELFYAWRELLEKVSKATVVRIKAFKPGSLSSTVTQTYFVFKNGSESYSLPVISIATDSLNLFGFEKGIYVPGVNYVEGNHGTGNYFQRGEDWERPASFEIFELDGSPGHKQDIGIRIHGGFSRRFPQKTLRLYARNIYGESRFNYRMFPESEYESYNRFILRNSGNDFGMSMFMDAAAQSLIRHFNVDTQAYRPVIVFLNGEYWGIKNVRERYDRRYLERVYGADPNNVDLMYGYLGVNEGDWNHYRAMVDYIERENLSDQAKFDYVTTLMDIDNFLDYYSAQIYYGNNDWPSNNIDFWRSRVDYNPNAPPGLDGRWRWLLYDVDRSLGFSTGAEFDMFPLLLRNHWSTRIFRNLMENDQFKTVFINRISDHLNTAFIPERVSSVIDSLKKPLEPEIDEHIGRWQNHDNRLEWEIHIEGMHMYATERPGHLRQHMHNHFELGDDVTLTVHVSSDEHGFVRVNTTDIHSATPGIGNTPYPWSGRYFSKIPVTLTALSEPSSRFSHWEIDGEEPVYEPEISRRFSSSASVKAVFISDFEEITPHALSGGYFLFTEWNEDEKEGSNPPSMRFVFMNQTEPGLEAGVAGLTSGRYDLDSRTRINGLGEDGFSFINTGNLEGNPGYPGLRLGGAVLSLDTSGEENIRVSWRGGTVLPNSRIYNLRLQYRVGTEGPFQDVLDEEGEAVEYLSNEEAGHSEFIGPVTLPDAAEGQPEVQLLWRYYFTGEQEAEQSGQRSQLNISEIHVTGFPSGLYPEPHRLSEQDYRFEHWPPDAETGSTPSGMAFVYMDEYDPSLHAEILGFTGGSFGHNSRTRITGLGENGFSFINTGNQQGNPGYPGTRLGGALLGLDTRDMAQIEVRFTGNTILPNSRIYNLRLQYRVGNEGPFLDVPDQYGDPVEYLRNQIAGHSEEIGPVVLPAEADDQEYVQLLWRYYYTGEQVDSDNGQRTKLGVADIAVAGRQPLFGGEPIPDEFALYQNYPNPFNPGTIIKFDLPEQQHVRIEVFNIAGQRVAVLTDEIWLAGTHRLPFNGSALASGIYIYRIATGSFAESKRMTFIK